MTDTPLTVPRRLSGPAQSRRTQGAVAALWLVVLAVLGVSSLWLAPIAFLAAGAGAGYSLSGSV